MKKRLLKTHEEYTEWYNEIHEKFSPNIDCEEEPIPNTYPCVVMWYEDYGGFWDEDNCYYHFVYLTDFE